MNEILEKSEIAPKVTRYVLHVPDIARARKAGQFVIIRLDAQGERIPLTIADGDATRGTITLVVQEVGKSTAQMARMSPGDRILDVVGPLGTATHVANLGRVVGVGGGIGIAPLHPICQAMRAAGSRVEAILGARTRELLIMEPEMRAACDETIVCTDDGSYGQKGFVTQVLAQLVEARGKPDLVVAIGPLVMMRATAEVTRKLGIRTLVSLNPVMVDGTGMCGGCRITAGGQVKFVCVNGPEFDAHEVDFDELLRRQRFYLEEERGAYQRFLAEAEHGPGGCRIRGEGGGT